VALGWARSQVIVIDDDLGASAAAPDSREGFARLVAEVTMGRAGIVLGTEMSRLARTGKDWHHLLELCSLSGTLLADPDAVYDPGYYNDRLLLGLKGTVSEAEIFLIRQRMLSAKRAKAGRGELIVQLPIGYVRRPSGEPAFDPDEQAQHVVRLIFGTFRRLGTLNAVLRYLVQHEIQLPARVRSGPAKGDLEWRRPTRETLQNMLRNPAYAGYYAYGRRQTDPRRKLPGRPDTGRVVRAEDEWLVLLPGRLPAYLTEEEYRANLARLSANRQTAESPGAPRDGEALLSGLLRCGLCGGHRMSVRYHTRRRADGRAAHGYACAFYPVNYGTGDPCQHIAGPALDAYVAARVLDAVAPAALEVSMAAAAQAEDERSALDKLWRQRVERARYAADRARRQYQLADPENRLVTRQLEAGWEAALAEAGRLEAEYQRFTEQTPAALTTAERNAIRALAAGLPAVWSAPATTRADRKELRAGLHGRPTSVAISPDGAVLAAGYYDGSVRIFGVTCHCLLKTLHTDSRTISGMAFAPGGHTLVTVSGDQELRLWLVGTWSNPVTIGAGNEPLVAVAVSQASPMVATDDGTTVRLWSTDPAQVATQLCDTLGGPLPPSDWERYDLTEIAYTPICPQRAA
jgi:DNA invertase Pin-like site-specific DNA recombinase